MIEEVQGVLDLSLNDPEYLLDANCLIDPYKRYYQMSFDLSEHFWNRLK